MNRGCFISIEGGEGSGKTTLITALKKDLEEQGRTVTATREPGGVFIAEQIRSILLDRGNTDMDARTEALLYAAARRQHLVERIMPVLNAGDIVVSDRFIDSSLVYQGYARDIGIEEVWQVNAFAVEQCMPDVTYFLDIEPEIGLERIRSNQNREVNRFDLEHIEFHRKVREGFLLLARRFPERIVVVNANQDPRAVHLEIKNDMNTSRL